MILTIFVTLFFLQQRVLSKQPVWHFLAIAYPYLSPTAPLDTPTSTSPAVLTGTMQTTASAQLLTTKNSEVVISLISIGVAGIAPGTSLGDNNGLSPQSIAPVGSQTVQNEINQGQIVPASQLAATSTPFPLPTSRPVVIPTITPIPQPSITPYSAVINTSSSIANIFQNWINSTLGNNAVAPQTQINSDQIDVRKITPTITPLPSNTGTRPGITPSPTITPKSTSLASSANLDTIKSLISDTTHKDNKTELTLNKNKVEGIVIVPQAYAAEKTEKPLLPQEIDNNAPVSGGILVTLDQKAGGSFVTRQDELKVKRGNTSFSISNQESNPATSSTKNNTQSSDSKQTAVNQTSNVQVSDSNPPTIGPGEPTPAPLQLEIKANDVIAQTTMALSVDPLSGFLSVQTPSGPQRVTIMPDEAMGIVTELKAINAKTSTNSSMNLVSENGQLMYRIPGNKIEKFLGMFPLSIQKEILVSVDTGSIIKVELPPLYRIISYFTF